MDELETTREIADTGHRTAAIPSAGSGAVSAREAAAALRISERTIRRAIQRGDLAATKQGRAFRIAPESLAAYQTRTQRPAISVMAPRGRHVSVVKSVCPRLPSILPVEPDRPAGFQSDRIPVLRHTEPL